MKNKLFCLYTGLVCFMLIFAIFAPYIVPQDPFYSDIASSLQEPSAQHWFGTDKLGRDVFSRLLYGMRLSLFTAITIVFCIASIGSIMGAIAGYFGGKIEQVIMRLVDIMLAFPGIVLAIAIAGILGGSIGNAILALTIVGWAKYARMARSVTLKVCNEDYIAAAKVQGGTTFNIIKRHIFPNVLPLVVVTGAMDLGVMMVEVAGLSFLGFGAQPPTPEWGLMINDGRQYLQSSPYLMMFPGLAIFIVVSIFNLWSDALRDKMDPRQ